ncbi:MAG: hypothetical protein GY828_03065 [Candidatus Gracilibacteria bacterium]|nr:hypothetical protein [Candidatus Gracilibacteria bacterium]
MSDYTSVNGYTITRRHIILPIIRLVKFIFLLGLSVFLYWLYFKVKAFYPDLIYLDITFFIFVFGTLNYAFISLILGLISYYFDLLVVYKDQIVMIKCSLLFRDDIEIIDSYRVMKVDGYSRGFCANIFGYGNLVIEQQKDEVKILHFIPRPYKILLIIQKQRESLLEERRKKYIISEEDNQKEKS